MGNSRWDNNDWDRYASSTRGKSTSQIFNASSIKADMDPAKIKVRESRDSTANPDSTPIILALDVTGSMGMIADTLAREGLGTLVEEILERKPVSDPHIMVMGVGDAFYDNAPLQVSQFEADIKIAKQLKEIFLEHGGGGNHSESYTLPWYFASEKTDIDCVKHGRKGMLFTFGDEECPPDLRAEQIRRIIGDKIQGDINTADLLEQVSKKYDVFHVVIEQGDYAQRNKKAVYDSWSKVLPADRIISVKDYKQLPAILVSVMEVHAGKDKDDVANSWQGKTVDVVKDAIKNVKPGDKPPGVKVFSPLKLKTPKAA
ncbi:MAG: VWA domain-containing protein [Alphaproteobacteria bacterium]|nr:MAG: VWA domain-containing protein [Alphaproteobacteria bacterium]